MSQTAPEPNVPPSYASTAQNDRQGTLAERLLTLAEMLYDCGGGKRELVIAEYDPGEVNLARIALAVKLTKKPKVFILRAVVENWDQQRLMCEMF